MSSDFSILSTLSVLPPLPALALELRETFFFEECTDEQLRWTVDNSTVEVINGGTVLFPENVLADSLWILLNGEVQVSRTIDGREIIIDRTTRPGTWSGWLPQFEIKPMGMSSRLMQDSRLLRVPKESVRYMLANGFPIMNHLLMGLMMGTKTLVGAAAQQEKMAALGRFSAGLAHELNNPAAAAKRAATDLREAIRKREQHAITLVQNLDSAVVRQNLQIVHDIGEREPFQLDPLARSEAEDEIADWLDRNGVEESYQLSGSLIDSSITIDDLELLKSRVPAAMMTDAVCWLEASAAQDELSMVIETSVTRISELVAAIKEYTFMDRDGQQEVELHHGIDSTLLILNHELKHGIEVVRDYAEEMPPVCAYGSELNQVWTNIIDNAVQAMEGRGRLTIHTEREGNMALVRISDNGPGIPPEIKHRIFDPFFTTKGVGIGTGLGLDIVRRVVRHHGGNIEVQSEPGETTFSVWLPLEKE